MLRSLLLCATISVLSVVPSRAFFAGLPAAAKQQTQSSSITFLQMSTVAEPPTKEKTSRKTGRKTNSPGENDNIDNDNDDNTDYPDLEYLQDYAESREMDDPFHILLLGSTFEKPKITVTYVAGSLEYVLHMPFDEAAELSGFSQQEGMACLGTWPREECLSLGKQLQVRDIVCRVVPYCEGGHRGWQAKDANEFSNSGSSGGGGGGGSSDSSFD